MGESIQKSELQNYQKQLLESSANAQRLSFLYYSRHENKSWTSKLRSLLTVEVKEFCQRNEIEKLSLFCSVIRDDFNLKSDINLIAEFASEKALGLAIVDLQDELSQMLRKEVDLITPAELSPFFREKVMDKAILIYGKDR